jgi:predicted Rossmann fold nucleotide-binding protein DprA/Smf involved in DNA uptake
MPVGRSGRIVVEFDPELKARLHARLRSEGRDFKGWLLERVQDYLCAPREKEGAPRDREEAASQLGEIESELTEIEKRVLDALSADEPVQHHLDHLLDATGLPVGKIHVALLRLELQGLVAQHLGFYKRVRPS